MSHIRFVFEDESHLSIYRPMGQLLYLTEAEYESDWQSYTHSHHFAELFYVRSGNGNFMLNNELIPVTKGDLLLINAHCPHTETSDGDNPLSYIVMGINSIAFDTTFASTLKNNQYGFLKLHEQSAILPLMQMMGQEARSERPHYMDYCQALYEQIMITIMRENNIDLQFTKTEDISATCASLKAYIEKNYHTELSLDTMADRLHVNKFHLAHRFTKEYGMPPIQYLISIRMREAQNLLSNSDFSVSQISEMCGFSSLSYFGQSFKRETSMSASEYRRAAKEGARYSKHSSH